MTLWVIGVVRVSAATIRPIEPIPVVLRLCRSVMVVDTRTPRRGEGGVFGSGRWLDQGPRPQAGEGVAEMVDICGVGPAVWSFRGELAGAEGASTSSVTCFRWIGSSRRRRGRRCR